MSLTLGEKLRQAREARGIPISEVAEQTRIAPLYLESIDNDDYRALPGGIFNRGFVKSYARYVGVDEQEALLDYAKLLNETEGGDGKEVKTYRPQVLTDDNTNHSMIPTLIVAAIILGLMTGGVLFLVSYLRQPTESQSENIPPRTNVNSINTNSVAESEKTPDTVTPAAPKMETVKIEFKAVDGDVSLKSTVDSDAPVNENISPGSTKTFEPKSLLKLSYSGYRAQFAQLTINGKPIVLPSQTAKPIGFEINKDNLEQIWTSGSISTEVPSSNVNANTKLRTQSTNSPGNATR